MSIERLEKIKTANELPPVVFLAGPETYLVDQYVLKLIEIGTAPETRDFNLDVLLAADVDIRRIVELARSYPMMSDRRVVVVKDIQKLAASDLSGLIDYCKKPNQSTCLILTQPDVSKQNKSLQQLQKLTLYVPCKPLYENQVVGWIEKHLKSLGYEIEPSAATLLAVQVGTNLHDLKNEIEKILLYVDERRHIETEDVARVVGFRKEFSLFSLQNAIGRKNLEDALRICRILLIGKPPQAIILHLAQFFHNLLITSGFKPSAKSDDELAKLTSTSRYFIRDLYQFKARYSVAEIENALEILRQVDYSLKNYSVNDKMMLEQVIIQIVKGYPAHELAFVSKI